MSDRSLRGMRLGSQSMETESGVEPAPRQRVEYKTEDGESVFVIFAQEAEVPSTWTSKSGKEAYIINGEGEQSEQAEKAIRTHWDMLLERRSIEELEDTLQQRLDVYRERYAI